MKHKQMIRFMPKGVLSKKKKKNAQRGKKFQLKRNNAQQRTVKNQLSIRTQVNLQGGQHKPENDYHFLS